MLKYTNIFIVIVSLWQRSESITSRNQYFNLRSKLQRLIMEIPDNVNTRESQAEILLNWKAHWSLTKQAFMKNTADLLQQARLCVWILKTLSVICQKLHEAFRSDATGKSASTLWNCAQLCTWTAGGYYPDVTQVWDVIFHYFHV